MEITNHYPQQPSTSLLSDEKGRLFLVDFNVITNTTKGLGFIDYYTPLDEDETTKEIEIIDCFITNDDLENMNQANQYEENIINEYLTQIYNEA